MRRAATSRRWLSTAPPKPQMPRKVSGRGPGSVAGQPPDPNDGRKYRQEHDYTVTPSTYSYVADTNRDQFERFPLVTAKALARRKGAARPRRVRMLSREFIEDSMYNPRYGYFSQHAEIFRPDEPFDFGKMRSIEAFLDSWSRSYHEQARAPVKPNSETPAVSPLGAIQRTSRQLWHTPTELFHPYYGWALARYMLATLGKDEPLIVYEAGGGNGTLMADVLDFVRREAPDVYKTAQYHVIEISAGLALRQRAVATGHADKVEIHHTSVADWHREVPEPCFFVALEVWDNLSHDVIRYDNTTDAPYQGYVVVDGNGDFTEVFSSDLDPLARDFLNLRSSVQWRPDRQLGIHPLSIPRPLRYIKNAVIPFHGNLSSPEYIPTRFIEFLRVLKKFPRHRLLAADFSTLSARIPGYASPVVQTFMESQPVPISSYMALQGYFDIMFPTDFTLSSQLYYAVTGKTATTKPHGAFLRDWATSADTATKSGEDPMLAFYRNASFLYS